MSVRGQIQGRWRKLYSDKLCNLSSLNITMLVILRTISRVGHVLRTGGEGEEDKRIQKFCEGIRIKETVIPRCSWKYNNKTDLKQELRAWTGFTRLRMSSIKYGEILDSLRSYQILKEGVHPIQSVSWLGYFVCFRSRAFTPLLDSSDEG
jgi:hypothetical protein